jgi:hypothetical protein
MGKGVSGALLCTKSTHSVFNSRAHCARDALWGGSHPYKAQQGLLIHNVQILVNTSLFFMHFSCTSKWMQRDELFGIFSCFLLLKSAAAAHSSVCAERHKGVAALRGAGRECYIQAFPFI